MTSAGLLEVGRLGRAHGVRGELNVHLSTDRTERLAVGAVFHARGQVLTVRSARRQSDRWVVGFAEITDRTEAEKWSQVVLLAEPIEDPDAWWVHDLIGARVVEQRTGIDRGICVAVLDNPAHDLLELDSGALVPIPFVVSLADGVVVIDPPDGLFSLAD